MCVTVSISRADQGHYAKGVLKGVGKQKERMWGEGLCLGRLSGHRTVIVADLSKMAFVWFTQELW